MSKKGLGRGLDALMGDLPLRDDVQTPAKKGSQQSLPIEFLVAAKDQPRKQFSDTAIAELAASIKEKGLLQPILVRPLPSPQSTYEIVAGERRWRAAQMAGLHDVPVIIRELNNGEAAEIALIENIQRVDLNPIEEADAYHRLVEHHGRTAPEIADAVGKSRSHIANLMRLRELPKAVKAMVVDGKLSMGHARALLGTDDPEALAAKVVRDGLTVRQIEKLAGGDTEKQLLKKKKSKPVSPASGSSKIKDADIRAFERVIEEALGLEVKLDHHGKSGGRLSIDYKTLDQLDDICKRLSGLGI